MNPSSTGSLKDGVTGKLIDRAKYTTLSMAYSIPTRTGTTNARYQFGGVNTERVRFFHRCSVSVADSNSQTKRYVPRPHQSPSLWIVQRRTNIFVHDGGSGGFGLRDLPLSRKPIAIGKMFKASSDLASLLYPLGRFTLRGHRDGSKKLWHLRKGATRSKKGDFECQWRD